MKHFFGVYSVMEAHQESVREWDRNPPYTLRR